jgi:hypothetical protein
MSTPFLLLIFQALAFAAKTPENRAMLHRDEEQDFLIPPS